MTAALLDVKPETGKLWSSSNPLGRLGQVSLHDGSLCGSPREFDWVLTILHADRAGA